MPDPAQQLRHARESGGAFRLPPRLRIRLSGRDAFRYLNGQVTRDLKPLEEQAGDGAALPACILTPKGKLCAPLLISRDGADLIVESYLLLEEPLTARLERYIVADDVAVSVEPAVGVIHVFGKASGMEPWSSLPGIGVTRRGVPGKDVSTASIGSELPESLDPDLVEILRIERGIPKWGAELTEETLPPEAGLDRTHIDYDRGCYPGQEVISRLKSIGRVNRLLHGFTAQGEGSLVAGMRILSAEGKEIGSLTSASLLPGEEGSVALGYLPRGSGEPLFALDPLTGARRALSITATFGT